jgi:AAA family ATP:ADP antiporter
MASPEARAGAGAPSTAPPILTRLATRLDLGSDELKRALALGLILAGITGSYTLSKTVRDAHFLTELPVSLLPYVYLGVGAASVIASVLFARLTRRAATWEALAIISLVAAISLAVFGQLFRIDAHWVPVSFYVWNNVYGLLVVSQFWLFANSVSNSREARRTFGLIGLGGILGGLAGGLVAAPLAHVWSLSALLTAAAVVQAAVVLLVRKGSPRAAEAEAEPAAVEGAARSTANGYVRALALAALCSVMVAGVVDYQFKAALQRRFTHSSELVSFLGVFYTLTGLLAFALQALGTRWMIQRFGASWSASLLPTGLGITTVITLIAPGFVPVVVGRVWDQVARVSVGQAVGELFYFPLHPALRRRVRSFISSGLERLGDAFAGILILAAGLTVGATTRNLAVMTAVLLAGWALAWMRVRRGYVTELGQNLRRMNLEHHRSRVSLREAEILREMERLLESRFERVVTQGIDLLVENAPERLAERLDGLLDHPSPAVRARALEAVRALRLERLAAHVERMIHDADPEVQVEALCTHAAFVAEDAYAALEKFLDSPDARVRRAAIVCVAEQAPPEAEARLAERFAGFMRSGDAAMRATVAQALGRRPAPSALHGMLATLIADPDLGTRRAALASAGKLGLRQHIPLLIEALGVRGTEDTARAALVALGNRVIGTLGDYLGDTSVVIEIRHAIPRVLAEVPMQESVDALFRCRDFSDSRLAYRILKASNRIRSSEAQVHFPRDLITEDIERDVRLHWFARLHRRAVAAAGTNAEGLLAVALEERSEQALNRLFRRLALIYSPQNIAAAYQGVGSLEPRRLGNAIEYLENQLSREHRSLILPLLDERGDAERMRLAEARFGIRTGGYEHTLQQLIEGDDPWLRACALFVVGARKERSLLSLVESNLSTLNALVRETASWARLALATGA